MTNEKILKVAQEDYDLALADSTFVCPYDAARHAAKNRIVAEVCNNYRIKSTLFLTEEMKELIWHLWTEFESVAV